MAKVKPAELWQKCADLLFERSDRWGPLNEAVRAAVVVAVDGDTLVVGLAGESQHLRGHLETASNRHRVLGCLKELTGRDLDYEVIQGTAAEDWESHKQGRESLGRKTPRSESAEAAPAEMQIQESGAEAAANSPWEAMMERLHLAYQSSRTRTQPIVRARFLMEALPILAEAESKAARQGDSEDRIQHSLTRAMERIASLVDLSATQVALEFLRYQAAGPPPKPARKKS